MWLFWIVAGLLAAAAAVAVVARAAAAARRAEAGVEDPALSVYRRQLSEIDDLAERGLLAEGERKAAHAEAGRRLLAAADRQGVDEASGAGRSNALVLGGLAAALLAALGLYFAIGAPGAPDLPYRARLAAWRADPSKLKPPEMAALLRQLVAQRPRDPEALAFLGRAELAAGDATAAAAALRRAVALQPARPELRLMLGEALLAASEDGASPEADAAFREVLRLDPMNFPARYFLARAQVVSGDRAAGLAAMQALVAELPAGDPRRAALEADIAQAAAPGVAAAGDGEQAAFIKSMVERLAARLKQSPDDPDGWARLVRAYGVLGDRKAQSEALDQARKLFAGRPADLSRIEAEARGR